MKNFRLFLTVFFSVVMTVSVWSANPTTDPYLFRDFESGIGGFHAPDGGGTVTWVANPNPSGINTSAYVMQVVSPAGANWGGAIYSERHGIGSDMMLEFGVDAITGYDYVEIDMYRVSNTNTPNFKTVDLDDDGQINPDRTPYMVNDVKGGALQVGVWQKITYNITNCHNIGANFVYIMPDREGSSTVYIDNIVFRKDMVKPVMVSADVNQENNTSIALSVAATDNLSDPVTRFWVSLDGTFANAEKYVAVGGIVTVTGLESGTTYDFTVWAEDYAGNVSDNTGSCSGTTTSVTPSTSAYCSQPFSVGGNTIYLTCTQESTHQFKMVIEGSNLQGLSAGCWCYVYDPSHNMSTYQYGAAGNWSVSSDHTTITVLFDSYFAPFFYCPLYVLMPGEVIFSSGIHNADFVWGSCGPVDDVPPVMVSAAENAVTTSSVTLSVSATDDVTNPVTQYEVTKDNGGSWQSYTAVDGKITIDGLTASTTYTFTVKAVDNAGNKSLNDKSVISTTLDWTAPASNYCDKDVTLTQNNFTLTATVSAEQVSADNYVLTITLNTVVHSSKNVVAFNATGLKLGAVSLDPTIVGNTVTGTFSSSTTPDISTISLSVLATYKNGNTGSQSFSLSTLSDVVWGTCGADTIAPVMNCTATRYVKTANASAVIAVSATDNVGVTGWQISTDDGAHWTAATVVDGNMKVAVSSETTYSLQVRALDAAGNHSEPCTVSFTTPAAPPTCSNSGEAGSGVTTLNNETPFPAGCSWEVVVTQTDNEELLIEGTFTHPDYQWDQTNAYIQLFPDTAYKQTASQSQIEYSNTTERERIDDHTMRYYKTITKADIDAKNASLWQQGMLLVAIKIAYPSGETHLTDPFFFMIGGGCVREQFIIWHHDDAPNAAAITSFSGNRIWLPIQYKRVFTPGTWETLCLPFDVKSVKVFDPDDNADYELTAYTGSNAGNYWLRTFGSPVIASEFQGNWTNTTTTLPRKDVPYIMMVPGDEQGYGNYYEGKVITFYGDAGQQMNTSFSRIATPSADLFNYGGNTTMMCQSLGDCYTITADGWYFVSSHSVTLYPFEGYVVTDPATILRVPSLRMRPGHVATELPEIEATDYNCWVSGNQLQVEANKSVNIRVYTVSGQWITTMQLATGEQQTLTLPRGIYLLQDGTNTRKIAM